MIQLMIDDPQTDAVRSVMLNEVVPHKMWYMADDNQITPILTDIPEAYNMPRQQLPKTYYQNGNVDVLRPANIFEMNSMTRKKIKGYEMKEMYDVDTEADFARVAAFMKDKQ